MLDGTIARPVRVVQVTGNNLELQDARDQMICERWTRAGTDITQEDLSVMHYLCDLINGPMEPVKVPAVKAEAPKPKKKKVVLRRRVPLSQLRLPPRRKHLPE